MKNRVIGKLAHGLTAVAIMAVIMGFASAAGAVYYPPSSRSVTWQGNVGVSGDIPNRTVIYKTLNPSGADDTSAIQTAVNNCPSGQVVFLNSGTFNVTKIDMKSNVTLRGAGMGETILKGNPTSSNYVISLGTSASRLGTSYNLASGYTKGSTNITASTTTGWQAGDVILIDQTNSGASADPPVYNNGYDGADTWDTRSSGSRGINQLVKVTSVSGNSATLEIPLYWNFDSTLSPQGTKVTMGAQNAGVENLTVDSNASFNSNTNTTTVMMFGSANNWLLGVEITGVWMEAVWMESAYRNTVRSCRMHIAHQYTTGGGAAMLVTYGASANLIEDCIFDSLVGGPTLQNGSGNVIAYNYAANMVYSSNSGTLVWGISNNHGVHPYMNLFEGNYLEGCYISADNIWGSSSHNTWFRNRVQVKSEFTTGYTNILNNIAIWHNNTYYNLIGNVLGTSGFENYYVLNKLPFSGSTKTAYVLGATTSSGSGSTGLETSTLIRWGNWDSYTNDHNNGNGVVWDSANNNSTDHTLPPSLYLTAKPSWWTAGQPQALPWPPIGPDVNQFFNDIPAKKRYKAPVLNP